MRMLVLRGAFGEFECARTRELIARYLPATPAHDKERRGRGDRRDGLGQEILCVLCELCVHSSSVTSMIVDITR